MILKQKWRKQNWTNKKRLNFIFVIILIKYHSRSLPCCIYFQKKTQHPHALHRGAHEQKIQRDRSCRSACLGKAHVPPVHMTDPVQASHGWCCWPERVEKQCSASYRRGKTAWHWCHNSAAPPKHGKQKSMASWWMKISRKASPKKGTAAMARRGIRLWNLALLPC
jgi:hypothetical protein